jgi:N-acetylmuramoyl-L-alanine amidase
MAPPPEHETRELIEQLRNRRFRRRWTRVALIGLGAVVILAVVVTGVVLATATPNDDASGSTLSSVAQFATTEEVTTTSTTSARPATTDTVTTARPRTSSTTTTAEPTTTSAAATTTSAPATTTTTSRFAGKVIVIDPGHQAHADSALEPVGPGSSAKKAKVSSGTASILTGIPESAVALQVGLKLQAALHGLGVKVVMTRTAQDVDIPNSQRAQIGNKAGADLTVRLHCNGSGDRSVHGLFTLYPAPIKGWTDDIATVSKRAATIIQRDLVAATGAQDRGLQERSDLSGFNWSDVPVLLVEMGYMTNPAEDGQLRSGAYQDKIVQGLVRGISDFLKTQ